MVVCSRVEVIVLTKRENRSQETHFLGWPHMTGKELYYIAEAHFNGHLAGIAYQMP